MPLDPLADLRTRLRKLEILFRSRYLERSSITDGVMTFIGGKLRLLAGAVLEIIGTVNGSGAFNWTGTMNQTGPTNLRGPVNITGENGTLTVDAETLLRGLTRILDDLQVEAGGRIKVGGITLTPLGGGRIEVGTSGIIIDAASRSITIPGANPITISTDGSIAKIDLGAADIMSNGAQGVMVAGDYLVGVDATRAALGAAYANFAASGGALYLVGVDEVGTGTGTVTGIGVDQNGKIVKMTTPV